MIENNETTELRRCKASNEVLITNPVKFQCVDCGQVWPSGDEIPFCKLQDSSQEETKENNPENPGKKQDTKFKKGQSGNPAGKPKGTLSFKTKWERFIEKVAESKGVTPEEIDDQLLSVGLKKAASGDHKFWQDIHDRIYGKAPQTVNTNITGSLDIGEEKKKEIEDALDQLIN